MIKNIIFDFGDVFVNLDKSATPREMQKFGFTRITPELDTLFKNYEKGIVSSDAFLNKISKLFPHASQQDLINAWNAIFLDFPEERLIFLEKLAKEQKYRLFLLSNTNELHIEYEKQKMGERWERFKNAFEVFYLSYEINMRKPDVEIFEFVLGENNLFPQETLFIDDTKDNTDSASELGIKTWHLQVGKQDVIQLKNYL